jgi:hypothetical protein
MGVQDTMKFFIQDGLGR